MTAIATALPAEYDHPPGIGINNFNACERSTSSTNSTFASQSGTDMSLTARWRG